MPPAASPAKKKPSAAGIIIGIVLMIISPVSGRVLIGTTASNATSEFTSATAYGADGVKHEVPVKAGQETGIWTGPDMTTGVCKVWDSAGNLATIRLPVGTTTVGDYKLSRIFVPAKDDVYSVACQSDDQTVWHYKVAATVSVVGIVAVIIGGVVLVLVSGLVGLILLIVTLVRRSGWKKKYGPGAVSAPGAVGQLGVPQGYYGPGPAYGPASGQPGAPAYGAVPGQPGAPAYGPSSGQPGAPAYGAVPGQPSSPAYGPRLVSRPPRPTRPSRPSAPNPRADPSATGMQPV